MSTLLAIETSCDETGVAVVSERAGKITVLAQELASQADVHALTGGVVPEVAARQHVEIIGPLVAKVLQESGVTGPDLNGIAVTVGPGLMPALSVGVNTARTLSYAWKVPLLPAHHLEGHIYSALLDPGDTPDGYLIPESGAIFPSLALIVSGGHTQFIKVTDHLTYEVIGASVDDAAGEAFDKVARLLGLSYPGGPKVAEIAVSGNPRAFSFPRPMLDSGDLNVSFSGLKTAIRYELAERKLTEQDKADVAASFQAAVVDTLVAKATLALEQEKPKRFLLAGGVAANEQLRTSLEQLCAAHDVAFTAAKPELCGDNGVMIGQVGLFALKQKRVSPWRDIDASAKLAIN